MKIYLNSGKFSFNAGNAKLWIHHPYPLDPNPKDVYHADFIPISRGYSASGMKF